MRTLQAFTAITNEVDDADDAVKALLSQIPLNKLKAHTLGIIACHYEFALSGVLKRVAEALPFKTVGTISSAQGTTQGAGSFELTVTVLTSDVVEFVSQLSEPLVGNTREVVKETYDAAAKGLGARPDLMFIHGPFMLQNNGDDYLAELDEISHKAPLFGTLAVDDTLDFRYCYSIYQGETHTNRLVLTLIKGVRPTFFSAHLAPGKVTGDPAVITESEGALLSRVNDRPVVEYLADKGLATLVENSYAMASTPFILDYGDGTPPISRIFIQLTPNGKVILNGSVPVGAEFVLGRFNKEDAIETTRTVLSDVLANEAFSLDDGPSLMLAYSCISRSMALGSDFLAELEEVRRTIGAQTTFMMAYSGGEYCPTELSAQGAVNRFHNNALIICLL